MFLKDLLELKEQNLQIHDFNIKNVYIDKLDDIVNEYNDAYHRTIEMKPADVKDNTYINIDQEFNDKKPKFKVDDHVKISKYKNIFAKGYTPNWTE